MNGATKLEGASRNFNGLGEMQSTGTRILPFASCFLEGGAFEGTIASDEVNAGDVVGLRLSLNAQANLQIVKDVQLGTVFLKKYQKHVRMFAAKRNGLRCIVMSDFEYVDEASRIEREEINDRSTSESAQRAHVATK